MGGCALSSVISKSKNVKDLKFNTYCTLHNMCIKPNLENFLGIWGCDEFDLITNIYKKAIWYYIGIPRNTCIDAYTMDMGWYPPLINNFINYACLYNRIMKMTRIRLPKHILLWEISKHNDSWYGDFTKVCQLISYTLPMDTNIATNMKISVICVKNITKSNG